MRVAMPSVIRLLEYRALGRGGLCMRTHRQRGGKYQYKANPIKHLLLPRRDKTTLSGNDVCEPSGTIAMEKKA